MSTPWRAAAWMIVSPANAAMVSPFSLNSIVSALRPGRSSSFANPLCYRRKKTRTRRNAESTERTLDDATPSNGIANIHAWLFSASSCPSVLSALHGFNQISSGKCLATQRIGLGAAWPRPQIEASAITTESSSSSAWSHFFASMRCAALRGADAARRALAARLVLEEAHQVQRRVARLVVLREDHHRRRADEAPVGLQRVEIERDVAHRGGQDAARGAARQGSRRTCGPPACRRNIRRSAPSP